MKPVRIKAELLLAGVSQTEIAESLGVEKQRVNEVVNGRGTQLRIRKAVVKAIGKDPENPSDLELVFPDEKFRRPSGRIVKRVGFAA